MLAGVVVIATAVAVGGRLLVRVGNVPATGGACPLAACGGSAVPVPVQVSLLGVAAAVVRSRGRSVIVSAVVISATVVSAAVVSAVVSAVVVVSSNAGAVLAPAAAPGVLGQIVVVVIVIVEAASVASARAARVSVPSLPVSSVVTVVGASAVAASIPALPTAVTVAVVALFCAATGACCSSVVFVVRIPA